MDKYEIIKKSIEKYLQKHKIEYGYNEEEGYYVTDFLLEDGTGLDFGIAVMEDGMVSYAMLPFEVPEVMYKRIVEYITRANYGLLSGNFEFDYTEGRIQYKTFFYIPGDKVYDDEIEALLMTPFAVISRYLEGMRKILNDPTSNVQVIVGEIEG